MNKALPLVVGLLLALTGCNRVEESTSIVPTIYHNWVELDETASEATKIQSSYPYFSIADSTFELILPRTMYYNLYTSDEDTIVDVYELQPHTSLVVCSFRVSSQPTDDAYLVTDDYFIKRTVYSKEVELVEKK